MLDPESAIFWFFVAGTLGVATKVAWEVSNRIGREITAEDLLPLAPWEGPPLPRFTKTKPGLLAELRRR